MTFIILSEQLAAAVVWYCFIIKTLRRRAIVVAVSCGRRHRTWETHRLPDVVTPGALIRMWEPRTVGLPLVTSNPAGRVSATCSSAGLTIISLHLHLLEHCVGQSNCVMKYEHCVGQSNCVMKYENLSDFCVIVFAYGYSSIYF